MDMSVKLNAPYPAARAADPVVLDRPAHGMAVSESAKGSDTGSGTSKDGEKHTEQVHAAVQEIEKFFKATRRNLEFSTDEDTGRIVVKVIASDTGLLVRQIPSEDVLRIAHSLSDANSLLFDAKA